VVEGFVSSAQVKSLIVNTKFLFLTQNRVSAGSCDIKLFTDVINKLECFIFSASHFNPYLIFLGSARSLTFVQSSVWDSNWVGSSLTC
jgi:hypothetical protein